MLQSTRSKCAASILIIAAVGSVGTIALASPPSNFTGEPLVLGDLNRERHVDGHNIKFENSAPLDTGVFRLEWSADGKSGWHHHPGMVVVQVASGRVKVINANCGSRTYGPGLADGSVFLEGDTVHQVVSGEGAVAYATALVENGQPLRVEDNPPNCASGGPAVRTP